MKLLKPYRALIDSIDREIIELLRQRYDVIEEVGHLKAREGIDSVLPDRVDEVRENAARLAGSKGLDEDFIRRLYAQLIDHSCAREEVIIRATRKTRAATAAKTARPARTPGTAKHKDRRPKKKVA